MANSPATVDIETALVDPQTYANPRAMDELFRFLRNEEPVRWNEPEGFRPFWSVTKLKDIQEVERQPDNFINAPRTFLRSIEYEENARKATGGHPALLRSLVFMDPPDHKVYRKLTQEWFQPKQIKSLEARFRELANEIVDAMISKGPECDFAADVGPWYPLRVIMEILGVPREDEPLMHQLTQEIFGSDDPDVQAKRSGTTNLADTVAEFAKYFTALTKDRRKNPTNDLATLFATAEIDGRPMADHEAISYYVLVATAGHDTTSSSIAGGLLALIENPDQMEKLRVDSSLMKTAVDEIIRWVSPVRHFFRTATQDYELEGNTIKSGESLMMCYPSANRDETIFEDPYVFRVDRRPSQHIAFGYGPHLCLGMHMARMEISIFFETLLSKISDVQLNGEPAWLASATVGGLKRLPIKFQMT